MPFYVVNKILEKASLRRQKGTYQKTIPKTTKKPIHKRVSFLISHIISTKAKASLTVETAIVLPIFTFAMISILFFSEVIRYSDIVASRLHQNAREMAVYSYAVNKGIKNIPGVAGIAGGMLLSETYVKSNVSNALKESGIKENGISYLRSKILTDDIIDLVAVENIQLPYEFLGIGEFSIMDRARVHAFTGYDNSQNSDKEEQEEIVYITPGGEVYHTDRGCRHLKITIKNIAAANIEKARNDSGGKYYACEYCMKSEKVSTYYVTEYGDRYHIRSDCSALKRDVVAVKISQVAGRRPCKSCGG